MTIIVALEVQDIRKYKRYLKTSDMIVKWNEMKCEMKLWMALLTVTVHAK